MNFQSAGSSSYRPQSFRRIVPVTVLQQTSNLVIPGHADKLETLKTSLDFCANSRPDQLLKVEAGQKESYANPLLMISQLATEELFERAEREKGLNPHRYEPVNAIEAAETSLQKGIPEEIQIWPYPILDNFAKTGSAQLFELPLKHGLRQDPEKTREYLKSIKKEALKHGPSAIQEYKDLQEMARLQEQNRGGGKRFSQLEAKLKVNDLQEELDRNWTPEGILAFSERLLSGLSRMDVLSRSYERVHEFLDKLKGRVRETRANRLIEEEMAEKQKMQTPSKSAKKKARQKAAKAQRAAAQQEASRQEARKDIAPVERLEAGSSSSAERIKPQGSLPLEASLQAPAMAAMPAHHQELPTERPEVGQERLKSQVTEPKTSPETGMVEPKPSKQEKPLQTYSRRKQAWRERSSAPLPTRQPVQERTQSAPETSVWTDFSQFLRSLTREGAPIIRNHFRPEARQQIHQAEALMNARWAEAMRQATMPNSDVVIYSSANP